MITKLQNVSDFHHIKIMEYNRMCITNIHWTSRNVYKINVNYLPPFVLQSTKITLQAVNIKTLKSSNKSNKLIFTYQLKASSKNDFLNSYFMPTVCSLIHCSSQTSKKIIYIGIGLLDKLLCLILTYV